MKKNLPWILGIGAVFLLCTALSVWFFTGTGGNTARVYSDGECIREIDLSRVTEPYSFSVESPYGVNEVRVEPGRISVTDSDCPDRICISTGWVSRAGMPIVCLPHRLVIRISGGEPELDGIVR